MNIIIVGAGGVGYSLADNLNAEGHQITLIDTNAERLNSALEKIDVQGIAGNGVSHEILTEAGVASAHLLIAVTDQDEVNMLCCLMAKKLSGCQTIARVRNPVYYRQINLIKDELGLSMAINPESATAGEIFDLIQIPGAQTHESFAKGRVNMIEIIIPEGSPADNIKVMDFPGKISRGTLICILERGRTREVEIPRGDTVLKAGDRIYIITPPREMATLFKRLGFQTRPTRNVMIIGGGRTGYYLADMLLGAGSRVKIIEKNRAVCEGLSAQLPGAEIICGDAIDRQLLLEEGIAGEDVFVPLTDMDEENILLALYAKKISKVRAITKVSTFGFTEVTEELPVGSIINPKEITAYSILRYVRAMSNSSDSSNIESLYYLANRRVEALEFHIKADSAVTNIPLSELRPRMIPDLLICCIYRGGQLIIPRGNDEIRQGDTVVLVTTARKLQSINDILK